LALEYPILVIFDLDGVLINSREVHFEAMNSALKALDYPIIPKDDHLSTYDGLPTTRKLKLLTEKEGYPSPSDYDKIWKLKQEYSKDIFDELQPSEKLIEIFITLKDRGYKIAVASNSIRNTIILILARLGILEYVDIIQSNEDVKRPKPYPEMIWNAMQAVGTIPSRTLILEDSHIGRQGAIDSGAHLMPIEDENDVKLQELLEAADRINGIPKAKVPWKDKKLNVLIPMAGAGSRFFQAGYTFPKPLIEVQGKPMIQKVVENLNIEANYIFLVQKEHYEKYHLQYLLQLIAPGCKIVLVDGLTKGAACTTLLAKEYIDNDNPLMIANSDQILDWNANEVMYAFSADKIDGGIVTFEASHPKWSFASLDEDGFVSQVAEKLVISNLATVGVYYWKHGADYVKYVEQMISKDIMTNGEFYVAPVFNEAIADGKKIRTKTIDKMWGIGDPESLNIYLENNRV